VSAKPLLVTVRYVLPLLLLLGGVLMFAIAPEQSVGIDGLCMGIGAALALLVMNVLWRIGFSGDAEREAEEAARRYLVEHGRWPDED
jgi:hypothetical protein